MARLEIHQFPCLNDNYGYLVHEPSTGMTAAIDTPEVAPILAALTEKGWKLTHILNTHHHFDHAGGNTGLKEKTGCVVIGPKGEKHKIPGIDRAVGEGDVVELGAARARVIDVPGHTAGHIAYSFDEDRVAFVGDTLFALGCGRLFEGTPAQMWTSLGKLMALPDDTTVYCAHEY
ncbi:MAG: hydroxyacylglutathione hydrolase, partial [Parvibaculum sp.]